MHQLQWARVQADSLDDALARFGAHVERHGGVDNWWSWVMALDGDVVHVREKEPWERDDHTDVRVETAQWLSTEAWVKGAWAEVWAHLGLEGLEPIQLGAPSAAELAKVQELAGLSAAQLRERFFAIAQPLEEPRADDDGIFADQRRALNEARRDALTALHEATAAPFLPSREPFDWPAHLVDGPGARVFWLAIDMHL